MNKHSQSFQNSKYALTLQYLIKEVRYEVEFLHASKFATRWYYHYWWAWSSILKILKVTSLHAISLQYIKKEVKNGVRFLHADKHQNFYKLALSFLIKVARYVQSTQSRKLIIFLQYIKEKYRNCFCVLLWYKTFKYFTEVQSCSSLRVLGGCSLKYAQSFRSWNS